jgi:hypothetical protein
VFREGLAAAAKADIEGTVKFATAGRGARLAAGDGAS